MSGTDFSNAQGTGIVTADGFNTPGGAKSPKAVVSTTITFDPPSLATVTDAVSSGITVTGAALGDSVELFPPYSLQGIIAVASVSAANTILISLRNPTAGTIDLASGTWGVVIWRR